MLRRTPGTGTQRARIAGLTRQEAAQEIMEFVEVAIQCILKTRQVYPSESFAMRRKYDLVVWQTRHPGLSQYFGEALATVRSQLLASGRLAGSPDRPMAEGEIGLRIQSRSTGEELERYTFRTLPVESELTLTRATLRLHFRALIARILELEHVPPSGEEHDRTVAVTLTIPGDQHLHPGEEQDWHRAPPVGGPETSLGPWTIETGVVDVKFSVAGISSRDLGAGQDAAAPVAEAASFSRPFLTGGVRSGADFGDDDDNDDD